MLVESQLDYHPQHRRYPALVSLYLRLGVWVEFINPSQTRTHSQHQPHCHSVLMLLEHTPWGSILAEIISALRLLSRSLSNHWLFLPGRMYVHTNSIDVTRCIWDALFDRTQYSSFMRVKRMSLTCVNMRIYAYMYTSQSNVIFVWW